MDFSLPLHLRSQLVHCRSRCISDMKLPTFHFNNWPKWFWSNIIVKLKFFLSVCTSTRHVFTNSNLNWDQIHLFFNWFISEPKKLRETERSNSMRRFNIWLCWVFYTQVFWQVKYSHSKGRPPVKDVSFFYKFINGPWPVCCMNMWLFGEAFCHNPISLKYQKSQRKKTERTWMHKWPALGDVLFCIVTYYD